MTEDILKITKSVYEQLSASEVCRKQARVCGQRGVQEAGEGLRKPHREAGKRRYNRIGNRPVQERQEHPQQCNLRRRDHARRYSTNYVGRDQGRLR